MRPPVLVVWLALAALACGERRAAPLPAIACAADPQAIGAIDDTRARGLLMRARDLAQRELARCDSAPARDAVAAIGAELAPATGILPNTGDARKARLAYRGGADARLAGQLERSVELFRLSLGESPHPLTWVQLGLTLRALGREVEANRANAMAMAMAEAWSGRDGALRLRTGHLDNVTAIAVRPDGAQLASGSADGTVRLWDVASGRETHVLGGHDGWVTAVAYHPDGETLASASRDGTVRLWSSGAGAEQHVSSAHGGEVGGVAFSADGAWLVSSGNGRVLVWSLPGFVQVRELADHAAPGHVVFSDDGRHVATLGDGFTVWRTDDWSRVVYRTGNRCTGAVFLADVLYCANGSLSRSFIRSRHILPREYESATGSGQAVLITAAMTSEGIALGATDGHVYVASRESSLVRSFPAHDGAVAAIGYRAQLGQLVTAGSDGSIKLWELDGTPVRTFDAKGVTVESIAFAGPGRLATIDTDGAVRSPTTSGEPLRLLERGDTIAPAEPEPAIPFEDGLPPLEPRTGTGRRARMPTVRIGTPITRIESAPSLAARRADDHWPGAQRLASTRDGALLAAGDDGGHLALWRTAPHAPVAATASGVGPIAAVALSDDGATLVATGWDGRVVLWPAPFDAPPQVVAGAGGVGLAIAVAPDRRRFAIAADDGTLAVGTLDEPARYHRADAHADGAYAVAYAPDGVHLASAGADGAVRLWRADTLAAVRTFDGHVDAVHAVAFSADGARLFSGSLDRSARVWSVSTGRELHAVHAGGRSGLSLARTPSGGVIAWRSEGRVVELWDVVAAARLGRVIVSRDGAWAVLADDRRLDGAGRDGADLTYWHYGAYQLPGFAGWQRFAEPDLLAHLLRGRGE